MVFVARMRTTNSIAPFGTSCNGIARDCNCFAIRVTSLLTIWPHFHWNFLVILQHAAAFIWQPVSIVTIYTYCGSVLRCLHRDQQQRCCEQHCHNVFCFHLLFLPQNAFFVFSNASKERFKQCTKVVCIVFPSLLWVYHIRFDMSTHIKQFFAFFFPIRHKMPHVWICSSRIETYLYYSFIWEVWLSWGNCLLSWYRSSITQSCSHVTGLCSIRSPRSSPLRIPFRNAQFTASFAQSAAVLSSGVSASCFVTFLARSPSRLCNQSPGQDLFANHLWTVSTILSGFGL